VVRRGRLRPPTDAPSTGEVHDELVATPTVTVEQILSGTVDTPVTFQADRHEWVALLTGAAVLDVDDETVELAPGDWIFLPAKTRHTLTTVQPGTTWLACSFSPG
jgi:cupin 2 domain-containing protein